MPPFTRDVFILLADIFYIFPLQLSGLDKFLTPNSVDTLLLRLQWINTEKCKRGEVIIKELHT